MKSRSACAGIVASFVFLAAPAGADDHHPPRAVIRSKGEARLGVVYESVWNEGTPESCATLTGSGPYDTHSALPARRGATVRIRFRTPREPASLNVIAWRRAKDGQPAGDAIPVDHDLEPRVVDEETVAWDAILDLPRFKRRLLLRAEGHWSDVDCSSDADQWARWAFKVKRP